MQTAFYTSQTSKDNQMAISIHKPIFLRVSHEFLRMIWHLKSILLGMAVLVFAGALGISHFENLPLSDALYFTMITGLTVGYGDITPQSMGGRIIAVMVALVGVIFSGLIVAVALRAVGQSLKKPKTN
jgi:voltage-gated potassium channel